MNLVKRYSAGIIICLLLFGCSFLDSGTKTLNEYCPTLNVNIYSFREGIGSTKKTWILHYHKSFQQKVDNYFSDKANGFTNESWFAIMNKQHMVDSKLYSDSVLTKTITEVHKQALIIYDKPAYRIIIIEQTLK